MTLQQAINIPSYYIYNYDLYIAFCKAAHKLWNRLPRDIKHIKSINSFKCFTQNTSAQNYF